MSSPSTPSATPFPPGPRLGWIDALRGYAILAVIAYHAAQELPGLPGFAGRALGLASTGVQLFFMVSAFTIFLTLDQARKRGRLSRRAFFLRRAMRIVPLFYLAMILETVLRVRAGNGLPAAELLATATFTSAWIPALCPTMVPGGWSIAVEMGFYALAPLLFGALRTLPRALLFAFGAVVMRAGLNESLARLVEDPHPLFPDFLFYWLPNQLPLFALGMVAYQAWRLRATSDSARTGDDSARAGDSSGEAGKEGRLLAAFLLLGSLYLMAAVVQGFQALLPFHLLFGLAFLLLMLHLMSHPSSLVANRPMQALGRVSYSAYIAHFFVLRYSAGFLLRRLEPLSLPPEARFAVLMAWTLALTWAVSWVLHKAVEAPGQALGRQWAERLGARRIPA